MYGFLISPNNVLSQCEPRGAVVKLINAVDYPHLQKDSTHFVFRPEPVDKAWSQGWAEDSVEASINRTRRLTLRSPEHDPADPCSK